MIERQPLVVFTLHDERNSQSRTRFNLQKGYTIEQMMGAVDDIYLPLSSICRGSFTRQSVTISYKNGAAGPPDIGSDCGRVAIFVFSTSTEGQYAEIEIPAVRDEYILSTGVDAGLVVDIDNPTIVSLIDTLKGGLWVNLFGYDIVELIGTAIAVRSN